MDATEFRNCLDVHTHLQARLQSLHEDFNTQPADHHAAPPDHGDDPNPLTEFEHAAVQLTAAFNGLQACTADDADELAPEIVHTHASLQTLVPTLGQARGAWAADTAQLCSEVDTLTALDQRLREDLLKSQTDFGAVALRSQERYDAHANQVAAALHKFEETAREVLLADLASRTTAWVEDLAGMRDERLHACQLDIAECLRNAHGRYMDVAEQIGNHYGDLAHDAVSELDRMASDEFTQAWERHVQNLKDRVLEKVAQEIAESIVETEVSVAISSALSAVMPELIAFYKALSLLEEAIRIFKELKDALSFI